MKHWVMIDEDGDAEVQADAEESPHEDYGYPAERCIEVDRPGRAHEVLVDGKWVIKASWLARDLLAAVDRIRDQRLDALLPSPGRRAIYDRKLADAWRHAESGQVSPLLDDEAKARNTTVEALALRIADKADAVAKVQEAIEVAAAKAKAAILSAGDDVSAMRAAAATFMETDHAGNSR